jgi:hypothetical protein
MKLRLGLLMLLHGMLSHRGIYHTDARRVAHAPLDVPRYLSGRYMPLLARDQSAGLCHKAMDVCASCAMAHHNYASTIVGLTLKLTSAEIAY